MTAPYPTATQLRFVLLVTFVAALGGLLLGYDTAVISGAVQHSTRRHRRATRLHEDGMTAKALPQAAVEGGGN